MTDETTVSGATPGGDTSGLIQTGLTDRRARDAAELESIARAYDKYVFRGRRKNPENEWLTDEFICRVHQDMFGEIWEWAGMYRRDNVNIGVDPHHISEQVRMLCGDFFYWDSRESSMPLMEVAARLQNRLTRIHPFQNGNGRHARLITDIYFRSQKHGLPQWPQIQLMSQGDKIREQYISAMKKADQEDYQDLIRFFENCLEKTQD